MEVPAPAPSPTAWIDDAVTTAAKTGYASAENTSLVVRSGDRDLVTVALEGQGFLGVKPGEQPHPIGYDLGAADEVRGWLAP